MFKIAEKDHFSSNPGWNPGSDPGSDPSSDPGSDPSSNPGSKFRYPQESWRKPCLVKCDRNSVYSSWRTAGIFCRLQGEIYRDCYINS